MGEYSKAELEVLAHITGDVETYIRIKADEDTQVDKLVFLTCLNDEEKIQYTKDQIAKIQKEFQQCRADIAPYIFALIQEHPSDKGLDYYQKEENIIKNFILAEFPETIDFLVNKDESFFDLPRFLPGVFSTLRLDEDLLDEFILYMTKASRYVSFTSFLTPEEESLTEETGSSKKKNNTLTTIVTIEKASFILKMLEDLSITKDGKYNLSDKKKSALRGVVEALRERNILPERSIDELCTILAAQIKMTLKSKLDKSYTSETFLKKANRYIDTNFKS